MPGQTLTATDMLEVLLERKKGSSGKTVIQDIEGLLKELQSSSIETSRRTLYRRLSELRRDGLIVQTNEYYRKYRLKPVKSLKNVIVVDQEDRILDHADLEDYKAILEDEGEIRLQVIEITEKGIKFMEKSNKDNNSEE